MHRLVALLCAALATVPVPAWSWDRAGHRAACAQAWEEMTAPARAAVQNLLDVTTAEQFAQTCTWADEVAVQRPETAAWHIITLPKNARAIDLARDCPKPESCVVEQIERHAAIVASDAPKAERAEALKFLAHLMGDVHQPLHVAFAEDAGGQKIAITFLGRPTNMHALWDSELLNAPNPPSRGYTPFLKQMTDRYNRERWTTGDVRDWAQETLWIMRAPPTGYVGNPGGLEFDDLYVKQNYLIATEQLEKAGVRLAFLLNDLFR